MYEKSIADLTRELDNGLAVYDYYYQLRMGKAFKPYKKLTSPFRPEERDPSFSVYKNRNNNNWWHTDFVHGEPANHWTFVMRLYGVDFNAAVAMVKQDVLREVGGVVDRSFRSYDISKVSIKRDVRFEKVERAWRPSDLEWFANFLITPDALQKFHVVPVSEYTRKGDREYTVKERFDDPIYFLEFPSGRTKIYRPKAPDYIDKNGKRRNGKWTSNLAANKDVFGWDLMPKKAERGFLMAGNKDTLSAFCLLDAENTKTATIALSAEGSELTSETWLHMQAVTSNWHLIYDWDDLKWHDHKQVWYRPGEDAAKKITDKYGIPLAIEPIQYYGEKDFAATVHSLVKTHNHDDLRNMRDYYLNL